LQEKAPWLDVPVLVARNVKERPGRDRGRHGAFNDTDNDMIAEKAKHYLVDLDIRGVILKEVNRYGDGHAAEMAVKAFLFYSANISAI
jgi:UDP-N-acetylglucosamine 2-epimerase